jgi:hypothetical protein
MRILFELVRTAFQAVASEAYNMRAISCMQIDRLHACMHVVSGGHDYRDVGIFSPYTTCGSE